MTLYEELYYCMDEYQKFYRFEGDKSFHFFSLEPTNHLMKTPKYVYFSASNKHHAYYVSKRLRQLIEQDILEETDLNLSKSTFMDKRAFNEVIQLVENYQLDDKMLSIECSTSPMISELLAMNFVSNTRKKSNDRRIERVDQQLFSGGYGFCGDWLEVFDLLTFFNSYRRITTSNMIEFLQISRRIVLGDKTGISPVGFLEDSRNLVVGVNPKVYSDFSKYELMNSLERIVDDGLYTKRTQLYRNPDEEIKKIVQEYNIERECFLETEEKIYQKRMNRN